MKFIIAALMLLSGISLQAQHIRGQVKDKVTGKGIAYLSIGINGTRVGTLTESSGHFELTIPDSLADRKLTLYGLGYKRQDVPLADFLDVGEQEILMEPLGDDLGEVTVNKKGDSGYVTEELVTAKRKAMSRAYRSLSPKNPEHSGTTIASRIQLSQPHFVLSASVWVAETTTDSLKFRLRLFEVDPETGLPSKDLLMNPKVHCFAGQKGWVEIKLDNEYTYLDKPEYFLAFELIEEKAERYRVHNARKQFRAQLKELHEQGVKGITPVDLEEDGKKITHYRLTLPPKKMKKLGLNPMVFTTKFEMVKGGELSVYRSSSFENWRVSELGVFRMKLKYEYESPSGR